MASVSIIDPTPGGNYILPGDSICVVGDLLDGATGAQLVLCPQLEQPNWANAVQVNNLSFVANVPYGGIAPPPASGGYKLVYRATIGPIHAPVPVPSSEDVVQFFRIPDQETVNDVFATQCLWYAFLPNPNAAGPQGYENPMSNYVPKGPFLIPLNAQSVDFAATQESPWQHDPKASTQSDPNGRIAHGPVGLEEAGYQHAQYGSNVIRVMTDHLNKLSALWKNGDGTGRTFEQFGIGTAWNGNVPKDAKKFGKLYLGMHDGREWSNNSGKVDTVEITWTAETCDQALARLAEEGRLKPENYKSSNPGK